MLKKIALLLLLLAALLTSMTATAQTAVPAVLNASPTLRDGQHDFDFNIGIWNTRIKRLTNPLSGPAVWTELNGTVTVRPIWGGRGQIEEIDAQGPLGRLDGMTAFLYNPESHQWSQTFASADDGTFNVPAVGSFKDGRGELYDQETFHGRVILVRAMWFDITPDAHRFEQAFSTDGGKTWEPNFVATLTRKAK